MNQSALVTGAGRACAHGFEIGDSDWEEIAVESEDEAADGLRIGTEG